MYILDENERLYFIGDCVVDVVDYLIILFYRNFTLDLH